MKTTKKKINLAELIEDKAQLIRVYHNRIKDGYTQQWEIEDIVYQLVAIHAVIRGSEAQIQNLDYQHLI